MVKLIVTGAAGKMGSRIIGLASSQKDFKLQGAIERKAHPCLGQDAGETAGCGRLGVSITDDIRAVLEQGDVVIDFTEPGSTLNHMEEAVRAKKAMVIGTTGLSAEQRLRIQALSKEIPCVLSPNMSVGVNILFKVLSDVAKVTGEDYDIEILEIHHRHKKDAPSGTALKMAQVLADALKRDLGKVVVYSRHGMIGERKKGEIGIQSLRAGDVVGEHTVIFAGLAERIEFTHRAYSRDNFARGALLAAQRIMNHPPGLYDMIDILGLSERR
jgi:4-hydroxy-tetrahydrodipicolinate reductase